MGGFLGGNAGMTEDWEKEEASYINASVSALSQRHKLAILLSVGIASGVEISNRLSINVLLPDMQGNVAANSDEISWVIILYNLGFLCSIALSIWMTRVIGARRHLLGSIALYALGATGCFFSAHSLQLLLISRLVMGFGGGAFLVRAVVLAGLMFPANLRMMAVTRLYAVFAFFEILYPVSIGWIDDHFHWNYAFLLDFPFLALAAFLIAKLVPHGYLFRRKPESRVDWWGAILLIVSLSCLQVATSRGERDLWFESPWVGPALVVAIACFIAFLWWDSRPQNNFPVLHLHMIWQNAALRTSLSLILLVGAIIGAGLYVLPQYLRFVQNYSATQTGGFVSMYTSGLVVGLLFALRLIIPRLGPTPTIGIGLALMVVTCGSIVFILTPTTPTAILAPAIFFQGVALGLVLLGASRIATGSAALPELNDIATMFFFVRQLGNTFGVTAATVLFDRRMTLHSARLLEVANALDPTVTSSLRHYANLIHRYGGGNRNPALGALQIFQANVITQSMLLSYADIYFGLAVLAALALILIAVKRIKDAPGPPHFHAM
jgi:MFS transporter, DHA2 family, multidrug resistance protein